MGKSKSKSKSVGGAAKTDGGKHASKTPHVDFKKGLKTRSQGKMSEKMFAAALALGDKQATANMHGGVGIPGKRDKAGVKAFPLLNFSKLKEQLSPILKMSKTVREMRGKGTDIQGIRDQVATVNRRVVFQKNAEDVHSLHVGNDIAAVSNTRGSKVYDYSDLAPRLDKRLREPESNGKQYWSSKLSLNERRSHVASGFKQLVGGNNASAQKTFAKVGFTAKGQKWVNKMSTLMLAERGRELHGGNGKKLETALNHVASGKSFSDVFVKNAGTLAPFAKRNGAKQLK